MAAYGQTISALASTSYPTNPQVSLTDYIDEFWAAVDTVSVVALSFDGIADHVLLDSVNYRTAQRELRFKKVWARKVSGADATVQIQSWTHA